MPTEKRFLRSKLIRHQVVIKIALGLPGNRAKQFAKWLEEEFSPENDHLDSDQMSEMLEAIDNIAENSRNAREARKLVCSEIYRLSKVGCRCDIKVKHFEPIMRYLHSQINSTNRTIQGLSNSNRETASVAA